MNCSYTPRFGNSHVKPRLCHKVEGSRDKTKYSTNVPALKYSDKYSQEHGEAVVLAARVGTVDSVWAGGQPRLPLWCWG